MALVRKDKPDWFALTDRVRAIFELEIASQAALARFLKVPDQRVREWIQHVREPKAQIVLSIERWIVTLSPIISLNAKAFAKSVKKFSEINT